MKKLIAIILALAALLMLGACGGKAEETAEEPVEEPINWTDVREEYGAVFEGGFWVDELENTFYFDANGEYGYICENESYTGKWYLLESDGVLCLELQGGLEKQYYLTKLTNTLVEMTDEQGADHTITKTESVPEVVQEEKEYEGEEFESSFGYSLVYDSGVFEVKSDDEGDTFSAEGVEVKVRRYSSNSVMSLAGGIEIQSEYDVTTETVKIGVTEAEGEKVVVDEPDMRHEYYLLAAGDDVLAVEIYGESSAVESCTDAIDTMLGSLAVL